MEALQRLHNRGSVSTGYEIDNSIKLEQPERIQRGYDGSGNIASITATDRKKTTLSYWVKRTQLNASGNGIVFIMYAGNTIMLGFENDKLRVSTSYGYSLKSNADFRDTSAWYHLVFSIDTTQGTANDRVKAYVNGAEVTSWGTQTISISQNANNGMFNEVNGSHYFGWLDAQATGCYVAEAHCIDGQALAASDFGEYDEDSCIWIPKEYEGTYGNQGYYLDFKTSSNLGTDSSGNGNNFGSLYGIGAENQATDTPTNNFCTFNPLMDQGNSPTITEGAMKSTGGGGNWNQTWGTIGTKSGKWYYEMKVTNTSYTGYFGASTTPAVGDYTNTVQLMYNTSFIVGEANSIDYYYWQNGSQVSNESTGWGGYSNNDVLGLALDLDASTKKFYLYKNGSLLNSGGTNLPTNMQDEFIFPLYVQYENKQDEINFGGYTISSISSAASDANGYGTFEYAPPSGYYALCTKNLEVYG